MEGARTSRKRKAKDQMYEFSASPPSLLPSLPEAHALPCYFEVAGCLPKTSVPVSPYTSTYTVPYCRPFMGIKTRDLGHFLVTVSLRLVLAMSMARKATCYLVEFEGLYECL